MTSNNDARASNNAQTFDLRSWKGLTEVLKAGRDAKLPPEEYAIFRDTVLFYAQRGGEGEMKRALQTLIANLHAHQQTIEEIPTETKNNREKTIGLRRGNATFAPKPLTNVEKNIVLELKNTRSETSTKKTPISIPGESLSSKTSEPVKVLSTPKPIPVVQPPVTFSIKKPSPLPPLTNTTHESLSPRPQMKPGNLTTPHVPKEEVLPRSQEDIRARITEIKHAVNSLVGNPVTLAASGNAEGKRYMSALLSAMKAAAPGSKENAQEGLKELQNAYDALQISLGKDKSGTSTGASGVAQKDASIGQNKLSEKTEQPQRTVAPHEASAPRERPQQHIVKPVTVKKTSATPIKPSTASEIPPDAERFNPSKIPDTLTTGEKQFVAQQNITGSTSRQNEQPSQNETTFQPISDPLPVQEEYDRLNNGNYDSTPTIDNIDITERSIPSRLDRALEEALHKAREKVAETNRTDDRSSISIPSSSEEYSSAEIPPPTEGSMTHSQSPLRQFSRPTGQIASLRRMSETPAVRRGGDNRLLNESNGSEEPTTLKNPSPAINPSQPPFASPRNRTDTKQVSQLPPIETFPPRATITTALEQRESENSPVRQSDLSSPEVTDALHQLLHEWKIFSSSGLFGIGPGGAEHPLYLQLAKLSMGEVVAGRWENADRDVSRTIKEYVDAWRHEQGVAYNPNETFEHYLRRVVDRILKRQHASNSV